MTWKEIVYKYRDWSVAVMNVSVEDNFGFPE